MRIRVSRLRRTFTAALATAMVVAVAGCGSADGGNAPDASSEVAAAGFPVAITSTLGTAEIKTRPSRVVTLGWGSTEAAVALGVIPVGMRDMSSDSGTDDGILPWVKDKLGDAKPVLLKETSKQIPVEQIASLKPDVILSVQSGLTSEQYEQLSRIAPTVAQPGRNWQTSWEDQTTIVGKALGKEDEAKTLVEQANQKIAAAKDAHPEFTGKTVASMSATAAEGLNFYFDTDPRTKLLAGLGFTPLPALTDLRHETGEGKFAAAVSWENVGKYNADVTTAWFGSDRQAPTEANPAFRALTSVQKNAFVPVTDPPLVFAVSSPNVLNLDWMLERYLPALSTAAKNAAQ